MITLAALLLFSVSQPGGQVFKCVDANGASIFSDKPCSPKAEKVLLPKSAPTPSDTKWCDVGDAEKSVIDACLEAWKPLFRDPRSTYADTGRLGMRMDKKTRTVIIDGHARNGFGGFNSVTMFCGVTNDGAIDRVETKNWTELFAAMSSIDRKLQGPTLEDCK